MLKPVVPDDIRVAKESFLTNLEGTTIWELFLAAALIPHLAYLACLVRSMADGASSDRLRLANFVIDVVMLTVPLTVTWMEAISLPKAHMLVMLLIIGLSALRGRRSHKTSEPSLREETYYSFVSEYRGGVILATSVAILAVDFPAFPRRFAKAERFGTGLMDIGVGAFVFANGLVKAAAQRRNPRAEPSLLRRALTGLRRVASLIVLGMVRLLSTRAVNYQQHIGEYGVHWNFFFTLAAVKLLTTLLPIPPRAMLPAGVLVTAGYQAALSLGGLIHWVHTEERGSGLVALNKEGFCSAFGYWGLYMMSVGVAGHVLSWTDTPGAPHKRGSRGPVAKRGSRGRPATDGRGWHMVPTWAPAAARVLALDAGLWLLLYASMAALGQPVSRRACNAPYCLWILALNLFLVACTWLQQQLLPHAPPGVLVALNFNMLPAFLWANLLTGAVNILVNTLAVPDWPARGVVSGYLVVVCALAAAAYRANMRLRL